MDWTHLVIIATYCLLSFFWAGCPCCNSVLPCEIDADAFDSAADPPDTAKWEERAGTDWQTTGGTLRTATSNALIKWKTEQPESIAEYVADVSIYGATGDELRVIVNYVDDSNYDFAQFTIGSSGCIALYKRVAGTNTLLSRKFASIPASTATSIRVWMGNNGTEYTFAAAAEITWSIRSPSVVRVGTGLYIGLGTGAIASTIRFDDFSFKRHWHSTVTPTCPRITYACDYYQLHLNNAGSTTDTTCSFTEQAGSWSLDSFSVGGMARVSTTDTNATLLCEAIHPNERGETGITARVFSATGGNLDGDLRLYMGWVDANNYFYANFNVTGGLVVLALNQVVAGTTTVLYTEDMGTYTVTGGSYFYACMANGRFNARWTGFDLANQTGRGALVTIPTTACKVGIGTGASSPSGIRAQELVLRRAYSGEDPSCAACPDICHEDCCDESINDLSLDLGSPGPLTNDTCDECTTPQGEIVLAAATGGGQPGCSWEYFVDMDCISACIDPIGGLNKTISRFLARATLTKDPDSPFKCYWRTSMFFIGGSGDSTTGEECTAGTSGGDRVQYASATTDADVAPCNSTGPWTLPKSTVATTGVNQYRGQSGWYVEGWISCDGTFPATMDLEYSA